MTEKLTIIFVMSNPTLSPRLRTDQDFRNVVDAVGGAMDRERFELVPLLAARPGDLQRALRRHRPQIVHFSGHAGEQGIAMEDDAGRMMIVDGDALAGLFQLLSGTIRLVVLSACLSRATAEGFRGFVDFTIAMRRSITDRAAIAFSRAFYEALADGAPIPAAFDHAVSGLRIECPEEADVPELLRRPGATESIAENKAKKRSKAKRSSGKGVDLRLSRSKATKIQIISGDNNTMG